MLFVASSSQAQACAAVTKQKQHKNNHSNRVETHCCLQQVPGHWKGTKGPSPSSSSSSSSFSLFSLSSFSVSLPVSRSSWRMPTPLSDPESPFSMPRLLPPLAGTSESPLVKVRVLIRRCLCNTHSYKHTVIFNMYIYLLGILSIFSSFPD